MRRRALALLWLVARSRGGGDGGGFLDFELSNGFELPVVGLGVGNLAHRSIPAVVSAGVERFGVRLVDTAMASNNEHLLQETLRRLPRPERRVVVVTKVWYTHLGYGRTRLAVEESLKSLGGGVDVVMLLHWPRCRDDIAWMRCAEEEAEAELRYRRAGPAPGADALGRELAGARGVMNGVVARAAAPGPPRSSTRSRRPAASTPRPWSSKRARLGVATVPARRRRATSPRTRRPRSRRAARWTLRARGRRAGHARAPPRREAAGDDRPAGVVATFKNAAQGAVRVFWENESTGERVPVTADIAPGTAERLSTHPGHKFVAYRGAELLKTFTVTAPRGGWQEFEL
ncbi:oxidoreductase [Aureococcus anophagefferens]|nr:oxidoreductase [Aureococcus anophagefferens]